MTVRRVVMRCATAGVVAVMATGVLVGAAVHLTQPAAAPPAPAAVAAPVAPGAVAAPVAVRIPALDVDSALVGLHVDRDGVLVPPDTADVAGWYADGPAPGETGPAVVAGHVDSHLGPGVFADLAQLRPGDRVEIDRADGSVAAFAVREVVQVAKAAFPTSEVYGPTTGPQLRLVTCGGEFDGDHYRDNVIVHADPADTDEWTFRY